MDMQNVKNLTIPEGGVKTIHDKDSRLLWGAVGYNTTYRGDTFQQTYQGYNLVDLVPITNGSISHSQHATIETVMDSTLGRNVLHIVGTDFYPTVTYNFPTSFEMGKYYNFKITYRTATAGVGSAANEFWFGLNTVGNTWDNLALFNVGVIDKGADGDTSRFFNASDTWVTKSKRFYADPSVLTSTNAFKRVQLSLGYGPGLNGVTAKEAWIADVQVCEITEAEWNADTYTSKDYEPYTGSTSTQITPSPNPDYPQDIQVVTGEQTVNVHGKNLFNPALFDGLSINSNGRVTTTKYYTQCTGVTMNLKPSTTYRITVRIADGTIANGSISFSVNGTWINTNLGTQVITTDSTGVIVVKAGAPSYSSIGLADATIQLEEGSTHTSYEPYIGYDYTVALGSIELCKIGTYQDYIYKSGDDWYVHKEIGKVILDGSENYARGFRNKTNTYAVAITNGVADTKWTSAGYVNDLKSDKFISYSFNYLYDASNDIEGICLDTANAFPKPPFVIALLKSRLSEVSINGVKAWLSTHNITVYYALATATDTKITDSTLISQLNAIHEWLTRYGYYGDVSGNLPMIIGRTNL